MPEYLRESLEGFKTRTSARLGLPPKLGSDRLFRSNSFSIRQDPGGVFGHPDSPDKAIGIREVACCENDRSVNKLIEVDAGIRVVGPTRRGSGNNFDTIPVKVTRGDRHAPRKSFGIGVKTGSRFGTRGMESLYMVTTPERAEAVVIRVEVAVPSKILFFAVVPVRMSSLYAFTGF